MIAKLIGIFAIVTALAAAVQAQGRFIFEDDPVDSAKTREVVRLLLEAERQVARNEIDAAIATYRSATEIERTQVGFRRGASLALATLLAGQGRNQEALAEYRHVYFWDIKRGDLTFTTGGLSGVADYALLLAKMGKQEEAKAMYYYGMRLFNVKGSRAIEPVPFLVVFDPEPLGTAWQYDIRSFEAATAILRMHDNWDAGNLERAKQLRPDWFLPVVWGDPRWVDQADALAQPGLEKSLVTQFRIDLADHAAANAAAGTPLASDKRPMTAGCERRRQMRCLRPDPNILRELVAGNGPR